MKKLFRIALFVLATIAAVGCTNDMDQTIAPEQDMVTVYFTTGKDATRTTLDKNLNVLWSDSDQLRIEYNDGDGNYGIAPAATIVENNGTDATFAINLPAGFEDKAVYAAYPYWAGGWGGYNNQLYGVPIADVQPMVNGGFGDNVNTSVCKLTWTGTEYTGRMVNVGGIIAVKVTGDVNIAKAVLTSKDGKVMAGTGTAYNISESGCSWDGHYTASNPKEITLNATTALNCAEGVELMFVACPNDFSGGFTLTLTDDNDATAEYDFAGGELARARILDLEAKTISAAEFGAVPSHPIVGEYVTAERVASQWACTPAGSNFTKTIFDSKNDRFGSPSGGQQFAIGYHHSYTDNILYFDLATEANADGTINLINLQDRASGGDQVSHNASYYDPATGNVHFEFIILGWWSPGGGGNPTLGADYDTPGEVYCFNLLKEIPSHPIVGEYNVAVATSQWARRDKSSDFNTTIYDSNYANFGTPADGQKFCVNYRKGWDAGLLYFDLAETANADGTINIINVKDRAATGDGDQVTHSASWYNPSTGVVHFDFIILGYWGPGGGGGAALDNEGDVAGEGYCVDMTPAE